MVYTPPLAGIQRSIQRVCTDPEIQSVSHARPRNEVVDLDSRSGGYPAIPLDLCGELSLSLTRGVRNSRPRWTMGRPRCCRWEVGRSFHGRHRETLGQYDRHSTIWDPPLRSTGSAIQVRAGRLELGAIRTAHANRQSVCSADPARRAGPCGKHCPQVWSGRQLVGPRYTPCLPYACVLFAHSVSSQRLV